MFDSEPVERLVVVERANHIVTVGNDVARVVAVIARRVGEPHEVQPIQRHAFAMMRRRQQSFDKQFISVRPLVLREFLNLFPRRRQPAQVERQSSNERDTIGFARWLQSRRIQLGEDEAVDVVLYEAGSPAFRKAGLLIK